MTTKQRRHRADRRKAIRREGWVLPVGYGQPDDPPEHGPYFTWETHDAMTGAPR